MNPNLISNLIKCNSKFHPPHPNVNKLENPIRNQTQSRFIQLVQIMRKKTFNVATLLWESVKMKLTPEMGIWESFETLETSEFHCRGQNTSHWGVIYIIVKLLNCRCWKWACMGHLDICSTRYGKKKGRESNWQFDFWALKVGNRPNPDGVGGVQYIVGKLSRRTTSLL